ncbi:NAD-dependent succinate-semialdehyde dehydrogenase [Hydrogenophaga sp.]|uniref:NAD-dependent succinate-semialdehyde dehydrogenase n=1 Tax=Hydrogenophaga sp. TaxID=1904254 RepID=UPI00262EBA7F|nr:NAD-dependent succinate-semialdehyde dehydrogenase [Hydrogenophaga sp.]MCW5652191.1 NAD-dependent succinate-semialdehyde dehydrogenase [Hydrogenophaga sp.]
MQTKTDASGVRYPTLELLIDGEWVGAQGRETAPVVNPATGQAIGRVPLASPADIDRAVRAAQRAFLSWRRETAITRARLLGKVADAVRAHTDELARILTLEQGKTLTESVGEITATADTFEWMAEEGKRAYGRTVPSRIPGAEQIVMLEPVGVVAALSPWNYPAALGARKVATALAAGCTVVLKPAEETPGIWVALAHLCFEAGLPPGTLNLLYGHPAEVSSRLIAAPEVRKISFTGSVPVGMQLAQQAAALLKKTTMELGGHSPTFVCEDAPIERVAELAVASKFRNAGQICHSPTRFFVHERVFDRFADAFAERAASLRVGNGLAQGVQMGPLANPRRMAAMAALCEDARKVGAAILTGGEPVVQGEGGNFWRPTVIARPPAATRALREEPFGPLALMVPYADLADAVEQANALDYGLGAFAFTPSLAQAQFLQEHVRAGCLSINTFAITPPELPFGGIKHSGLGREMGSEGLLDHFETKAVIRVAAP